jgi:predicted transcriptional regulator
MKQEDDYLDLSSRERQIMEILFRRRRATVSMIRAELPDPPTAPAVRTMLSRLEEKGYLAHTQDGPRNVYAATVSLQRARQSAVQRMMKTFFEGSPVKTVATILDETDARLSDEELAELTRLIERARRRDR